MRVVHTRQNDGDGTDTHVSHEQAYNPVVNPSAAVLASDRNARFSVLTPCVIRMEFSAHPGTGSFEDRATLAMINRNTPVPSFKQSSDGKKVTIDTACLHLEYTLGASSFNDGSLLVQSAASASVPFTWTPSVGLVSPNNLLGTIRSLDMISTVDLNCTNNANITVHDEALHCAWSPFSRDGWHVYDDSQTTLLAADDWVTNDTSGSSSDWYFFGHGHNYRAAVADYTLISGQHPLLPKFAMGVMWSRWYDLSFSDVRDLVLGGYASRGLPLDLFVLDMDWHSLWPGVGQDWTGWTFDRNLFQQPFDYFAWLRYYNLAASLNIHDAEGVKSHELRYPQMAAAMGVDPASNQTIPAQFDNRRYMEALEDIMLKPFQDASGHRFAIWRDWQQGGSTGISTRNLNPTIWLNHASVTDPYRRGESWRGWTLARYGGVGNQRYPTGFSGDVIHSWTALAFQVYFTTTASSVVYQWSNDIVGQDGTSSSNYEEHTRWVQWGAWSPLFRTHDAGAGVGSCADQGGCAVIEMWDVPKQHFEASRVHLQRRQELLPTWYSLNRAAYDTGLVPVRAMYFGWPEQANSYMQIVRNQQYTIGDNILVSPITAQMDTGSNSINWTTWLPADTLWFDSVGYQLINSTEYPNSNYSAAYSLIDVPVFYRAGSILARIPYNSSDTLAVARRDYTHLIFDIYPGGVGAGSAAVYEDDGETLAYATAGQFATTTANYTRAGSAGTVTVSVSTQGAYPGLPQSRAYSVRLVMSYPPVAVTVNGVAVPYARFGCSAGTRNLADIATCWWYDGETMTTVVTYAGASTAAGAATTFTITPRSVPNPLALNGVAGILQRANYVKREVLDPAIVPGDCKNKIYQLQWLAGAGDALTYAAQPAPAGNTTLFDGIVSQIQTTAPTALAQIRALDPSKTSSVRIAGATYLMASANGW